MSDSVFPIAILGAGPVGCALALMLARAVPDPARVVLVRGGPAPTGRDSAGTTGPGPSTRPAQAADARVLALNHGSRVVMESLGAWPRLAADIRTIHVSQRGRLGRTLIRHSDFNVAQLGSVVGYAALNDVLIERVAHSGVTVRTMHGAHMNNEGGVAAITAADGEVLRCGIAIQSDGAGADDVRREYGQHAVLTTVRAALPRPGWAFERFTREGPLALLPHPDGTDAYSVVWCCVPERARALAALDNAAFSRALSEIFGDRMGALACFTPRHVFPLFMGLRRHLVAGRCVAVGNAAQTLHPVAGQGLNLGLRDAARLAQSLAPWLQSPQVDPAPMLAAFARARHGDRGVTVALTDLMPRVFATGLAPVEHACGLALLGLDLAAPLRAPLARHLLQGLRA
jgi:2-octaprenyl-6-methoxyphenol hydroxylase